MIFMGRGRPKKDGVGKTKRITLRVSEDFFNELTELSTMDGQSKTEYIIKSVKAQSALTKLLHEEDDNYEPGFDDFDDGFDDDFDDF